MNFALICNNNYKYELKIYSYLHVSSMTSYKIYVNDRSYSSWEVFDTINFNKITLDINPQDSKLLSNDVFSINENNTINLLHSSIRSTTS